MNKASALPRRPLAMRLLRLLLPSARTLRMSVYGSFAFGLLGLAAARSVYADVREVGLDVGHELAKLEDLTGEGYVVHLNGADVHRSSAHTSQAVHDVMDRYEAYCKSSPGALGQAMQDIPSAMLDRVAMPKTSMRSSVVRDDDERHGMVVCFVEDPDAKPATLADRLTAVSRTGDLSQLGRFRYVYAERTKSGSTHVVTFWSDGELDVGKMFPARGDAPGTDSSIAPRPAGSRRTLSASVEGFPAAVRIYEAPGTRESVGAAIDQDLRGRGFMNVSNQPRSAGYLRESDSAQIFVSFSPLANGTINDGARSTRVGVTFVESAGARSRGVRVEEK